MTVTSIAARAQWTCTAAASLRGLRADVQDAVFWSKATRDQCVALSPDPRPANESVANWCELSNRDTRCEPRGDRRP